MRSRKIQKNHREKGFLFLDEEGTSLVVRQLMELRDIYCARPTGFLVKDLATGQEILPHQLGNYLAHKHGWPGLQQAKLGRRAAA